MTMPKSLTVSFVGVEPWAVDETGTKWPVVVEPSGSLLIALPDYEIRLGTAMVLDRMHARASAEAAARAHAAKADNPYLQPESYNDFMAGVEWARKNSA